MGLLFQENVHAWFKNWNCCTHNDNREEVCANWISNLVFFIVINKRCCKDDSKWLKHVSDNVNDCGSNVDVFSFISTSNVVKFALFWIFFIVFFIIVIVTAITIISVRMTMSMVMVMIMAVLHYSSNFDLFSSKAWEMPENCKTEQVAEQAYECNGKHDWSVNWFWSNEEYSPSCLVE